MLRQRIGDYFITQQIGATGPWSTYVALSAKSGEKRVVKTAVRLAATDVDDARFLREVRIIAGLQHPNILGILDRGVLEDCYYTMREFMPGESLGRHLSHGRLSPGDAVTLLLPACEAVVCAHERGVAHRRLKPSNILLGKSGPLVCDFGIAHALDKGKIGIVRTPEFIGGNAYLAPEQRVSGGRTDRRTDVYALGAILYEMVMGFPPLGSFRMPRDVFPGFPEAIHEILAKCLSVNPKGRFLHAGFVAYELEKYLESIGKRKAGLQSNPYQAMPSKHERPRLRVRVDRIERWFQILRTGSTRERLSVVREMIEKIEPREARAILKLFPGEDERVRWGLIKVLGELRVTAATPMILGELNSSFNRECAVEALGKIGSEEALFSPDKSVATDPEYNGKALLPLSQTGKIKAIRCLGGYLNHENARLRQGAVRAMASIVTPEALRILKNHLKQESDATVRSSLLQAIHSLETALQP